MLQPPSRATTRSSFDQQPARSITEPQRGIINVLVPATSNIPADERVLNERVLNERVLNERVLNMGGSVCWLPT